MRPSSFTTFAQQTTCALLVPSFPVWSHHLGTSRICKTGPTAKLVIGAVESKDRPMQSCGAISPAWTWGNSRHSMLRQSSTVFAPGIAARMEAVHSHGGRPFAWKVPSRFTLSSHFSLVHVQELPLSEWKHTPWCQHTPWGCFEARARKAEAKRVGLQHRIRVPRCRRHQSWTCFRLERKDVH